MLGSIMEGIGNISKHISRVKEINLYMLGIKPGLAINSNKNKPCTCIRGSSFRISKPGERSLILPRALTEGADPKSPQPRSGQDPAITDGTQRVQ